MNMEHGLHFKDIEKENKTKKMFFKMKFDTKMKKYKQGKSPTGFMTESEFAVQKYDTKIQRKYN